MSRNEPPELFRGHAPDAAYLGKALRQFAVRHGTRDSEIAP